MPISIPQNQTDAPTASTDTDVAAPAPEATHASSSDIPEYIPPLQLVPGRPSLVGVEENSLALVKSMKNLARLRLQALLGRASEAVVSHQRARTGADASGISEKDVALGLFGFGPAFCWDDAEAIWEIEKSKLFTRKSRKNDLIGDSTLGTHLSRADQNYRDGRVEEAREGYQFVEGQAKRTEFSLLITQGNLRLFRLGQPASAQQYYQRAARQLQDKHLYFAAYALLHQALCAHFIGAPEQASKVAGKAVSLMPDFVEARYQYAQYEMLAERPNSAIKELTKVFAEDRRYVLKTLADPTFAELHGALSSHMDEGVEALAEAREPLLTLGEEVAEVLDAPCIANSDVAALREEMAGHTRFIAEGARNRSFLDAYALNERALERFKEFTESIQAYIKEIEEKATEIRNQLRHKKDSLRSRAAGKQRLVAVASLLLGLGGCTAMLMDANDPSALISAVGLALATIVIGGLVSIAIPAMAARDEDTKKLAGEIAALECRTKALNRAHDLVGAQLRHTD